MILKKLLFFVLFLSSFCAIADTYPVSVGYKAINVNTGAWWPTIYSTGQQACTQTGTGYTPPANLIYQPPTSCSGNWGYVQVLNTCPNGGTISGSNCINAPACISPEVRKTIAPYNCSVPLECAYPETDNGNGICQNNTCPAGQVRNPTTTLCQVKPTCGSTETYDVYSNTCKLYPLNCPTNSHPNTANDACLANAPLVCPTGQHDDGTYNCVADDVSACTSGQYAGYINGQHQCVTKPNLDTAQQSALDKVAATQAAEAAALAKRLEYYAARDAYLAAQKASDADPLDASKAAAASAAFGTMQTKESQLATNESAVETAKNSQQSKESSNQSATLRSIDETLKQEGDIGTGDKQSSIDDYGDAAIDALDNTGTVTQSGSWFNAFPTIPEPGACVNIPMQYKSLNYTFSPCDKLAPFREMLSYFFYIVTTFFIIRIALGAN